METGYNFKTQFHKLNIGADYFTRWIKEAQDQKNINQELDPDLLVFFLTIINYNLEKFITKKLGITYNQILKRGFEYYKKPINEIIDQVTTFITKGVSI